MSTWTVTISYDGEQPSGFTDVEMEDDRDVYRYLLCILLDLQERYENPVLFVNDKRFRPKEEDVADYYQYLTECTEGKPPEPPPVSVACMRRYATDIQEHARDLKEQAEQVVASVHKPKPKTKVKVR